MVRFIAVFLLFCFITAFIRRIVHHSVRYILTARFVYTMPNSVHINVTVIDEAVKYL